MAKGRSIVPAKTRLREMEERLKGRRPSPLELQVLKELRDEVGASWDTVSGSWVKDGQ